MVLIIDNYDSFVYNIFHWLDVDKEQVKVVRNDQITISKIRKLNPEKIIISPGPMGPEQAGFSNDIIKTFGEYIPILGICLGHQCIGQVFGCDIDKHYQPTHGVQSEVKVTKKSPIFEGLGECFNVGRYHSLHIPSLTFNYEELDVCATLEDGTIMALQHNKHPIYGVQFHPESILTGNENGRRILNNFLNL